MNSQVVDPFHLQTQFQTNNSQYRGRFAPSPSGPLHFGSLIAALGSYLQAKSQDGLWFVRIEDIDKPREQTGSVDLILNSLERFGLIWDEDKQTTNEFNYRGCLVQSSRQQRYQQIFEQLKQAERLYTCHCTRKHIKKLGGMYRKTCRDKQLPFDDHAIRLKQDFTQGHFIDLLQGKVDVGPDLINEDYIIKRTGGLFAYQLVVVIDDIDQGITQVVRGADIIDLTPRQINLFNLLNMTPPNYLHLPLIMNNDGKKLSKQNHAPAIDCNNPVPELIKALSCLGLPINSLPDLATYSIPEITRWAIKNWDIKNIPTQLTMTI